MAVQRRSPDSREPRPDHPNRLMRAGKDAVSFRPMIDLPSRANGRTLRPVAVLFLALVATALLTGCGSSSTTASGSSPAASTSTTAASSASTPAAGSGTATYCTALKAFESSVAHLKDSGNVPGIVSSLKSVESTGQAVIVAVKTDFVSETGALKTSLAATSNTIHQLLGSGTRSAALQALPGEVTALKSSANAFINAAKPGCG